MLPTDVMNDYPGQPRERDRWILARRGARNQLDPFKPRAFFVEEERAESGEVVSVATIFLTNRECPWRCLMCDLWKNTLTETAPVGAVPAQIDCALAQLVAANASPQQISGESGRVLTDAAIRQIKLYNSGSFFDPRAIPPGDYVAIAERTRAFERVIVECHPALLGKSVLEFRDLLCVTHVRQAGPPHPRPTPNPSQEGNSAAALVASLPSFGGVRGGFGIARAALNSTARSAGAGQKLEVAMGLETAHAQVLGKLNKRMTLDQFRRAAKFLRQHEIALRVFVLVKPPFLDEAEALHWAKCSIDFAFDCGAKAVTLIPTRFGNGALEALGERGEFTPPKLATLETALDYGIGLKRGRVFADLWDVEKFSDCNECFQRRRARLQEMNLRQSAQPPVICDRCRERTR